MVDAEYECSECADEMRQMIERLQGMPAARRSTIVNAVSGDVAVCAKCEFCKVIADPDPNDSFNDDDRAVVCLKVRNREANPKAARASGRCVNRVVEAAVRPYQVGEVPVPDWCPLKKRTCMHS